MGRAAGMAAALGSASLFRWKEEPVMSDRRFYRTVSGRGKAGSEKLSGVTKTHSRAKL